MVTLRSLFATRSRVPFLPRKSSSSPFINAATHSIPSHPSLTNTNTKIFRSNRIRTFMLSSRSTEMDGRERKEEEEEESLSFHNREEDVNIASISDSSDDGDEEEEFEFSFVHQSHDQTEDDLADNLFRDGQIRPLYPVFDRSLLGEGIVDQELSLFNKLSIDDGENRSREEEEWRPDPESYCEWNPKVGAPSLSPRRKSRSAGESSSRRWRLRDLVVGRSHSDGKQKFDFLATEKNKEKGNEKKEKKVVVVEKKKKKGSSTETTMARAYRLYYAKDGAGGDRKQPNSNSHLPYRRNLFG